MGLNYHCLFLLVQVTKITVQIQLLPVEVTGFAVLQNSIMETSPRNLLELEVLQLQKILGIESRFHRKGYERKYQTSVLSQKTNPCNKRGYTVLFDTAFFPEHFAYLQIRQHVRLF